LVKALAVYGFRALTIFLLIIIPYNSLDYIKGLIYNLGNLIFGYNNLKRYIGAGMNRYFTIILNPTADQGNAKKRIPLIEEFFQKMQQISKLFLQRESVMLLPRKVCGISKIENQDNWFLRILVKEWGAIPVNRGTPGRIHI